jgi:hypothetical protein
MAEPKPNPVDPFEWRRHGVGWRLYRERRVVGCIVPDAQWPGMWRVKLPSGLSDMVNLTRARDGALGVAERAESEKKTQQNQWTFSGRSSLVRLNRRTPSTTSRPLKKRMEAA